MFIRTGQGNVDGVTGLLIKMGEIIAHDFSMIGRETLPENRLNFVHITFSTGEKSAKSFQYFLTNLEDYIKEAQKAKSNNIKRR